MARMRVHKQSLTSVMVVWKTVGTWSRGKLEVVYDVSSDVLPTAPSPISTTLMSSVACDARENAHKRYQREHPNKRPDAKQSKINYHQQ